MRRRLLTTLALVLCALRLPVASPESSALALARVRVSSPEQAAFVAGRFDETHNRLPGAVEVLLWPGDAARLQALGLEYEIVVADIAKRDAALARGDTIPAVDTPGPERESYRMLADYQTEMKELAAAHPSMVKLLTLPLRTLEGRPVYGLEIAAGVHAVDGRPTFAVDGIHHAREWPSGEYPMFFAHYLVEGFGRDQAITRLMKTIRFTIVPVVNPDGFAYTRSSPVEVVALGAVGQEAYWRKNRRSSTNTTNPVTGHNQDAYGVDPNRNYSFLWGDDQGGSSSVQAEQTYRGAAPFSEPESDNVKRLLLSRHVTAYVSNHTYSRLVLRPWGDREDVAPDNHVMEPLGEKMAEAMGDYQNITGLELYLTTGTASDWSYGTTGTLGYTFEHGTAFHPEFNENVAPETEGVIKAFMYGADAAANPKFHGILRGTVADRNGRPLPGATLTIRKSFENPLWPSNPTGSESQKHDLVTVNRSGPGGAFEWHVNPSTRPQVLAEGQTESYTLIVSAPGRTPATRTVVVGRGQVLNLGTIRIG